MHALGVLDGQWDNSNCTNSLVVLDFGQPDEQGGVYGTNVYDNNHTFYSDSQIIDAAKAYADGWWGATLSYPRLRIAIGTNNGGPNGITECPHTCDLTQWGSYWVATTYGLDYYLSLQGYAWQISAAGADDMETEWDPYSKTNQVVTGFNGGSGGHYYLFYDFGDATPGHGSNDNWTYQHIWQVAWGATFDLPLPEIYWCCQYSDWGNVETNAGNMTISGTMSECADSYNFPITQPYCSSGQYAPDKSWNLMLTVQNGHGQTSITYATNIKLQGAL
jgi:hypothetical protein